MTQNIAEEMLTCYGHVKRRDEGHVLRRMLDAPVPGKKWRGRQKITWKTFCKIYLKSVVLTVDDVLDRTPWKRDIQNQSGDPIWFRKVREVVQQEGDLPKQNIASPLDIRSFEPSVEEEEEEEECFFDRMFLVRRPTI